MANDPVRVLHVTDPHLFADKAGELRGTVTYESLVAVLDHYRDSGWQAEFVAATGDLVQDDSSAAYVHFRELLGDLDLPVHCIPGNHDVRETMQVELNGSPFLYCDAAEIGSWLIVGVDTCVPGRAGGEISASELQRLADICESSDAAHVMVCLHHPPVPMRSRWLDTVGLGNADEFFALARKIGRVRVALFGHVHQAYDAQHDGLRVIATPSTCRQFKPLSDDFAVDSRPPAYRRLSLHDDGSVATDLIWIGDA